jgi:hypothetical protein
VSNANAPELKIATQPTAAKNLRVRILIAPVPSRAARKEKPSASRHTKKIVWGKAEGEASNAMRPTSGKLPEQKTPAHVQVA